MSTNKITCSFTVDRDIYNAYKSIVVKGGENVKGNLIRYMLNVINYETPNADTISAIKEVEELKKNPNKKTKPYIYYNNKEYLYKEISSKYNLAPAESTFYGITTHFVEIKHRGR